MATYTGNKTREISFPLGGIGSGSVGLAGNGRLVDWEIFNRPAKGTANGFTHIALKAETEREVLDVRVLQGDYLGRATGGETPNIKEGNGGVGYGFGPFRGLMAGVPHFRECSFWGEYPLARIDFRDEHFPARVSLHACSPLIPLNDRDSSLPCAMFEVELENTCDERVEYTVYFSLNNPLPRGTTVNRYREEGDVKFIEMLSDGLEESEPLFGSLFLGTDGVEVSCQEYWYRFAWFDSLQTYWNDITKRGRLQNRRYENGEKRTAPAALDGEDMATLAAHLSLAPGERRRARFVLGWHFPNCCNYWNPEPGVEAPTIWRNYYATLFPDAAACGLYALGHFDRLQRETRLFHHALFATTLPAECLDAVSANLSILKTATCLRLEDGSFYAFEGCNPDSGCCEGSCTHVWNYAYALPYLFPKLERSMRELEYRYCQRADGGSAFRMMLPLGRQDDGFRPCVDGQMGSVIKCYREYLLCGDLEWLRRRWPGIKKAIEYAWSKDNPDQWDADRDGVMEGRQHHTLDMELFGPNSWLGGFYLAALLAGSRVAGLLGHSGEEALYAQLFARGKAWTDEHLWNGTHFIQRVDLTDRELLERYGEGNALVGRDTVDAYWNEETGEIKYQIGEGSAVDQVVAQWHANLIGLGELFDPGKVRRALRTIFETNYHTSMREVFNPARVYSYNDEGGVQICAWPQGAVKPNIPITYSAETMNGFEYQVAAHMLQEGMVEECFSIVRTVRDRFDGEKRNPWNEYECGSNYARSMASYALIPAAAGFTCDLGQMQLAFSPKVTGNDGAFCCFWSVETGWGLFHLGKNTASLEVLYGALALGRLELPRLEQEPAVVRCGKENCAFQWEGAALRFEAPLELAAGAVLVIELRGL